MEQANPLEGIKDWLHGTGAPKPPRETVAAAVRETLRTLEKVAPGHAVEVRVPPYGAVQCIDGPRHTRGTPPNVVEVEPRTWLRMAAGLEDYDPRFGSGTRAGEVAKWLPLYRLRPT